MIPRKVLVLSLFLFIFLITALSAVEYDDGNIRLIINERTGSFSLFFLSDPETMRYEPLFNSKQPSASFMSVNLDGHIHHLGKSKNFITRVETLNDNPIIIFESPSLTVSKLFTPVRTPRSPKINGYQITITIQNTGSQNVSAGLRLLLDTHLGEGRGKEHFYTDRQTIVNETLIEGASGEMFWISRNQNLSLMGSIINPFDSNSKVPDFVHIASWKRLYNTSWQLNYLEGRSFNYWPYFIRDSAVCYYYEPDILDSDSSFTYTIFLTTEDIQFFTGRFSIEDMLFAERTAIDEDAKLQLMYRLQEMLNQFIAGEIYLNEQDLDEIESTINRLREEIHSL